MPTPGPLEDCEVTYENNKRLILIRKPCGCEIKICVGETNASGTVFRWHYECKEHFNW